jgi:hypothetical protein
MPMKTWVCRFQDHEIRVVNTWFSGAKLFVDGQLVAKDTGLFSISRLKPLIDVDILDGHRIQVFVVALFTVQAAIFIDGLQYGGEELDISIDALRFKTQSERMKSLSADTGSAVAVPTKTSRTTE